MNIHWLSAEYSFYWFNQLKSLLLIHFKRAEQSATSNGGRGFAMIIYNSRLIYNSTTRLARPWRRFSTVLGRDGFVEDWTRRGNYNGFCPVISNYLLPANEIPARDACCPPRAREYSKFPAINSQGPPGEQKTAISSRKLLGPISSLFSANLSGHNPIPARQTRALQLIAAI